MGVPKVWDQESEGVVNAPLPRLVWERKGGGAPALAGSARSFFWPQEARHTIGPVYEILIEKIVQVPVERVRQVPVEHIVEQLVQVPIEHVVEKMVQFPRRVQGPPRENIVYVDRPVCQPVPVPRPYPTELAQGFGNLLLGFSRPRGFG